MDCQTGRRTNVSSVISYFILSIISSFIYPLASESRFQALRQPASGFVLPVAAVVDAVALPLLRDALPSSGVAEEVVVVAVVALRRRDRGAALGAPAVARTLRSGQTKRNGTTILIGVSVEVQIRCLMNQRKK